MTFVDETKGLSTNSDYESEYATPPPEARLTDMTSDFSTPTTDMFAESEHTPTFPLNIAPGHRKLEHSQSPNVLPSLNSPLNHRLWEQPSVSQTPEHVPLPFGPSANPLTIEGILNKGATESSHQEPPLLYDHVEESPRIPPIYSEHPIWPLADPAEAELLRHFVQKLAIWVSNGSPLRLPTFHALSNEIVY